MENSNTSSYQLTLQERIKRNRDVRREVRRAIRWRIKNLFVKQEPIYESPVITEARRFAMAKIRRAFFNKLLKYLNMKELYEEHIKMLYEAVQIYYTMLLKSVPLSKKILFIASLVYMILPMGLVIHKTFVLVVAFSLAVAAFIYALISICKHTTEEEKKKAKRKLTAWFSHLKKEELDIILK